MIKSLFFLAALLLSMIIDISAQSHVATTGSFCRYAKNSLRNKNVYAEGHTQCPACDAEDAKEAVARKAEDKRRTDVRAAEQAAKALAEKQAQETALKNKRAADKGVTELAVTMPANKANTATPTKKASVSVTGMAVGCLYDDAETDNHSVSDMIFDINQGERNNRVYKLYRDINYFVLNNRKILDNDEFKVCIGARRPSLDPENRDKFPPGIGIAILNETADNHVISDLVDATGKRLLNDDKISTILHFSGDYFILLEGKSFGRGAAPHASYDFSNGAIYNYKTKRRYELQPFQSANRRHVQVGWVVNGTYMDKKKLRDKSTYDAFFEVITGYDASMIYYITKEGKLEADEISK
ncbi:hypothetical protein SAMN05428949_6492 [Chitinophaga sp. YR627]|uniref:hypothetical protein n=1 Tax=Chitinophaga sp. YR627 TaxID=1881041 RepID=UPI0008F2F991|nr:hypothetical protein [Chitinophaga sp. YR627]SFO75505.1 hypothetical protein SAMN05428949_6492 [Chitinophaga sp. YR627]